MNHIDQDGDGQLSYEEFHYFVKFHSSEFKDFESLLSITAQGLGGLKALTKSVSEVTPD